MQDKQKQRTGMFVYQDSFINHVIWMYESVSSFIKWTNR